MSETEKALNYYKSAFERRRPDWVPSKICINGRISSDMPDAGYFANTGHHACECNQWGAVSVKAQNGKMLGIKPREFEVIEWRENPDPSKATLPPGAIGEGEK